MRTLLGSLAAALLMSSAQAGEMLLEDFSDDPAQRWSYISDQVMGGVSQGGIEFVADGGDGAYVRLTGDVSTANNGGFIQVRKTWTEPFPAGTDGVALTVRGNGERYFVHLRTTDSIRPWYYYQASFETGPDWAEVRLPLSGFEASHAVLPPAVDPETVTGFGILGYGRDHGADVSVARVALY